MGGGGEEGRGGELEGTCCGVGGLGLIEVGDAPRRGGVVAVK